MVRLHFQKALATHIVELQHSLWILLKTSDTGQLLEIILTPKAVIGFSKSRKAALHAYSSSSKDHYVFA
jgi:hypothetical protein